MTDRTLANESSTESVSVFGMGKVGITLAAALGGAGLRVTGVDVAAPLIKSLQDGSFTTNEPGVMDRFAKMKKGQFVPTSSAEEAVHNSPVSFIIVPTPSNTLGGFSNSYVLKCVESIGKALRGKKAFHTVSVISTILPGSSDTQIVPALEAAAGRKIGDNLGYCYNPSFIAQGEVMKGLVSPEYALIGEADAASGAAVEAIHRRILVNDAPIVRMTPMEAEITKISSNTHETMRVAFANMLLALCNEVPGANVDRITSALAYRLGRRFFKGAVPYGGPCWPRDNQALAAFMDLVGVPSTLPNAVDRANADHGHYVLRQILDAVPRGSSVGILGLAYKPATSMIDRSFGIDLANWLTMEGRKVVAWDPMANTEAKDVINPQAKIVARAEEVLQADVTVIALPLAELNKIDWSQGAKTRVIDCWRVLGAEHQEKVGSYAALGTEKDMPSRVHTTPGFGERFGHLTN